MNPVEYVRLDLDTRGGPEARQRTADRLMAGQIENDAPWMFGSQGDNA